MNLKIVLITFIVGAQILNGQNIDTILLKSEIAGLKTLTSKRAFLKKIYEEDQAYRGKDSNFTLDFQHLISISYFINQFDYPKRLDYGKYSSIPALVWIHNKYREIDKITFPIILKGFQMDEISEKDLRNYYLRGLYNDKVDDENFKKISLEKLFEICDLNLDDKISIKKILDAKTVIDSCNQLKVIRETLWKAEDTYKTFELNGKKIERKYDGDKIKIIYKIDGSIYLLKVYDDNSGEPIELEKLSTNRYKYKNQKTKKYYEIYANRVLFKNEIHLIKEYRKY